MNQAVQKTLEHSADALAAGGRFDRVSIAFHWMTVLLIIAQFTTAWMHDAGGDANIGAAMLTIHRSLGVLTWIVVVARLVWRHRFAYLPPFPPSMPKFQQWIAKANEYGLYALLLAQPMTGLGFVLFRGRAFGMFAWHVPALLASDETIFGLFHLAHELGALALMALIGLHATAALFHSLVLRDGVLERMLPWRSVDKHDPSSLWPLETAFGNARYRAATTAARGDEEEAYELETGTRGTRAP
jgi:superoxide oxidase